MSSDEEQDTCSICEGDKSTKRNPIIFCDGKDCDLPVHKICYKVDEIPDDDWFCERCENKRKKKPTNVICCPMQTGAIKRTATSGDFMHVVCAMWNKVIDENRVPFIVPTKQLNRHECYYCYKKKGFTMQCEADSCAIFFHATCAINNGIITPAPTAPADFSPRCNKHIAQFEKNMEARLQAADTFYDSDDKSMDYEEDDNEDDDETEDESEEEGASRKKKQKLSINQKRPAQQPLRKEIPSKRQSSPNLIFTDDSDNDICSNNQTNTKQRTASAPVAAKVNALAITSQKPTAQNSNANGNDKIGDIVKANVNDKAYTFKERLELKKRKIEHTNRPSLKIEDHKPKVSSISSPATTEKPTISIHGSSNSIARPGITPPLKKTKGPGIIKDIAEIQNDIKADAQRWNLNGSGNRNPASTPTAAKSSFLENDNTKRMLSNDEREELNRLRVEARRFNDFKRGVADIFSSLNVRLSNPITPPPDRDIEAYVAQLQQLVRRAGPIREQDSIIIQECVRNAMHRQRQ